MKNEKGILIISLDFELHWGERDRLNIENYKEKFSQPYPIVSSILKLFDKHKIHATWATTGFLFFQTRDELIKGLPARKPNYLNKRYSPYNEIDSIGDSEKKDPFHFASSLIKEIASTSYQEIGTHTFSHYFCLEEGQSIDEFREDLEAAIEVADRYNISLESIVFPRNQFNNAYLSISKEMGIKAYRGNESSWIYRARSGEDEGILIRGLRLVDAYLNISGHNCYSIDSIVLKPIFDFPSSRLLRPYSNNLKFLEPLRLQRILSDLTYAAEKGEVYHLWWHPHDFGLDLEKNILFLEKILNHYSRLKESHGMESLNMRELAYRLEQRKITKGKTIVMLARQGESTNIIYNSLKDDFIIEKVIIEKPISRFQFLKNRIKRLGVFTVFGQMLFQLMVVPYLRIVSGKRALKLKKEFGLNDAAIDPAKIINVASANSDETISLLKSIEPDIVIINGARIISDKVIGSTLTKFVNMHAGITPLYRGVHGAYWALVENNPKACGVTVHIVDAGIDTGPILAQVIIDPKKEDNIVTYPLLQLAAGIPLLKKAVNDVFENRVEIKPYPQGPSRLWSHPTLWGYIRHGFRLFKKYRI